MKKLCSILAVTVLASLIFGPGSARAADLCVQFNGSGCALSGDLGFFRFIGAKLPTSVSKVARINGRACGVGTVTGSAVQIPNSGNTVTLTATFECDAQLGVLHIIFPNVTGPVASGSTASGLASYGVFDILTDCTVTVVDCGTEPGL